MLHFFAGVYRSIKNRRPNGTPYFNLRMGIVGIMFLHYFQLAVLMRKYYDVNLIVASQTTFVLTLLSVSTPLMYLLTLIMPLEVLLNIEVSEIHVNRYNLLFFLYFFLNVLILGYLMLSNSKGNPPDIADTILQHVNHKFPICG